MSKDRRRHAATIAVAMVTALVTANAPAIAHGVHAVFAHNADKVDGVHAVKAKASKKKRRGKLVATSPTTGRLPNNIIKKAPNANKLDGFDSLDFLGIDDKAADSDLLDGLDSGDFLQSGDTIDADTLDGRGPEDFVGQSGSGIWLVQGDVSGWRSKVGSGTMTTAPDFDETTFTSTSVSGSATHFIVPQLPLASYGRELELTGIELCYDAGAAHVLDEVLLSRVQNSNGTAVTASETLDPADRSDDACRVYAPTSSAGTDETVGLEVGSTWTANGATLRLGRVTFMLEPTTTDATPLN